MDKREDKARQDFISHFIKTWNWNANCINVHFKVYIDIYKTDLIYISTMEMHSALVNHIVFLLDTKENNVYMSNLNLTIDICIIKLLLFTRLYLLYTKIMN